jgi:hypothetical protein
MARSRKTTDKPASGKRQIEPYDCQGLQRRNNPSIGLAVEAAGPGELEKRYAVAPVRALC